MISKQCSYAFAIRILITAKKETKLIWWTLQQFINPLSLFTQGHFAQSSSPHCPAFSLGSRLIACAGAPPPSASPGRIPIRCCTVGKHFGLLATVAHLSHKLRFHGSPSIFRQRQLIWCPLTCPPHSLHGEEKPACKMLPPGAAATCGVTRWPRHNEWPSSSPQKPRCQALPSPCVFCGVFVGL